jgi:hypothetical protein
MLDGYNGGYGTSGPFDRLGSREKAKCASLALAAIDYYMYLEGFENKGDLYEKILLKRHLVSGHKAVIRTVTRPDANADGGGVCSESAKIVDSQVNRDFAGEFSDIKRGVVNVVTPWLSLPDAREMNEVSCAISKAYDLIKDQSDIADLAAYIKDEIVKTVTDGQVSRVAKAYAYGIGSTIHNISDLVKVLYDVVSKNEEMMGGVLESRSDIFEKFVAKLNVNDGVDIKVLISVLQWAVGQIPNLVTGNYVGFVTGLASGGLSLANANLSKTESVDTVGYGTGEAARVLNTYFTTQNNNLRALEQGLSAFLDREYVRISAAQSGYSLGLEKSVEEASSVSPTFAIADKGALNTLVRDDLPTLSNKLKEVVQELNAINYSKAFSRSGYIGIGQNGINSAYVSMKDLICDLLLDVADDTDDMAHCLEQFLSDVNLTEEQSAAALRAAGQDNGRDTWRSLERVTSRHNAHLVAKGTY